MSRSSYNCERGNGIRITDASSFWLGFYMNQGPGLKQYSFVRHPGRPGAFGALMDEYARAAQDFCRVVETFDDSRFASEKLNSAIAA